MQPEASPNPGRNLCIERPSINRPTQRLLSSPIFAPVLNDVVGIPFRDNAVILSRTLEALEKELEEATG
jgi:hypothetical protein